MGYANISSYFNVGKVTDKMRVDALKVVIGAYLSAWG
jgi:hypothetical protein